MATVGAQPRPGGTATAELVAGNIICIRFSGHMNGAVVTQVLPAVSALIAKGARAVVFDATAVSTFDSDVRKPGFELVSTIRSAGITTATAAITSAAVRMIASAVAFGAGLPLEFFGTFDQALARVRELLAKQR